MSPTMIALRLLTETDRSLFMCGRYTLTTSTRPELSAFVTSLSDRFNIAPQSDVLIKNERQELTVMAWDLSPPWSTAPMHLFNARAETLNEKPSFRGAKRCAFLADGWYEWQRVSRGKQPWYHHRNGELLHFAGIYHPRSGCAIVTHSADAAIEHIHHRQPLLLDDKSLALWLEGASPEDSRSRLVVDAHRVSAAVSNGRRDDAQLTRPMDQLAEHPQQDLWS